MGEGKADRVINLNWLSNYNVHVIYIGIRVKESLLAEKVENRKIMTQN